MLKNSRSLVASCFVFAMTAAIAVAPSGPASAAIQTCGTSGSHAICISLESTSLSGSTLVTVSNSPNSGALVVTWTPTGKGAITLMQQGGPSAITGGLDYSFVWPTQKYLDASGSLKVRYGGKTSAPVAVDVALVNGNTSSIQPSPGDWSNFLPPATWSGGADPVIAAVGDGAYGTMLPQSVVTSIAAANPAVFLYLGDVYETGTYTELYSHYGSLALDGDVGSQWGALAPITQPTVGNHEYPNVGAWEDFWHQRPEAVSFDFGGVRFIDVNSSSNMKPGSSQYTFVQGLLGPTAPSCIIGFWHIPPILKGTNQPKIGPMWALLAGGGGDLVLNGHAHGNGEYKPMNASLLTDQPDSHTVDLIAGSSGDSLGGVGSDPRLAWKPTGKPLAVLYLTLNGAANGGTATSISWRYVMILTGAVLRSGTVAC